MRLAQHVRIARVSITVSSLTDNKLKKLPVHFYEFKLENYRQKLVCDHLKYLGFGNLQYLNPTKRRDIRRKKNTVCFDTF